MVELVEFYKLFGKKKLYLTTECDVFCPDTEKIFQIEVISGNNMNLHSRLT
jgi:hypothetical protein